VPGALAARLAEFLNDTGNRKCDANEVGEPAQSAAAHYGDFVQLERLKNDGQFGAKRTVVSVMPNGVGAIDGV
jgi:hypothetical protein